MRPVIYYVEHLVKDMDETKTFSRALISLIKYNNPKTIMHPILVFVLEVLWVNLATWQRGPKPAFGTMRDSRNSSSIASSFA